MLNAKADGIQNSLLKTEGYTRVGVVWASLTGKLGPI